MSLTLDLARCLEIDMLASCVRSRMLGPQLAESAQAYLGPSTGGLQVASSSWQG